MKPSKYPWPATRLSEPHLMHDLYVLAKAKKLPLTKLVEQAVRKHVSELRDRMDSPMADTYVNGQE